MKIIDCTPLADLPRVVLVLIPDKGFWLRVADEEGNVTAPFKDLSLTLPGARVRARRMGFDPEAWVNGSGQIIRFWDLLTEDTIKLLSMAREEYPERSWYVEGEGDDTVVTDGAWRLSMFRKMSLRGGPHVQVEIGEEWGHGLTLRDAVRCAEEAPAQRAEVEARIARMGARAQRREEEIP